VPFANRRILARAIGLPEESIEMIEVDVGGGFGSRGEFYPEDFLIPFAAKFSGRPVKWTEDRREHLMASNHARDVTCEIEIACTRDGEILGLRGHAYSNIGAYIRTNGSVGPRNVAQFLSGPYRVPNIDIRSTLLLSNRTPSGTYRGPGRFEADFIRERIFDLASADLGIDRVQFRKRNLVSQSELPYPLATITPYESKTELDSGDYQVTLDKCLQEFGWTEKSALQGKLIDGRYHGIAVGCFIEGGAAGPQEEARCVLEPSGLVRMYVGSTSIGQGLETIMIQIAADALELPMERLEILHGSTTYVKEGYGSYHSRSTVMGGSALLEAATKLRGLMREAAASRLRCTPSELESSGVGFRAPSGDEISLSELAPEQLSAEAVFSNKKYSYAYGAHAAHVAVDPRTGRVEVLDYVATEDVGRMINPLTLHGQVIGAIVQGLGGTFLEHFVYDDQGQLLTGSFADYLLPVATDYPRIRAFTTGDYPCPHNPLGAKGAGEGGIISVGGVIANAVASALSPLQVQPFELPLSPNRVWAMINQAHAAQRVGAVDAAA
jgi:carbon-monoxide dehydrogenase large subunit